MIEKPIAASQEEHRVIRLRGAQRQCGGTSALHPHSGVLKVVGTMEVVVLEAAAQSHAMANVCRLVLDLMIPWTRLCSSSPRFLCGGWRRRWRQRGADPITSMLLGFANGVVAALRQQDCSPADSQLSATCRRLVERFSTAAPYSRRTTNGVATAILYRKTVIERLRPSIDPLCRAWGHFCMRARLRISAGMARLQGLLWPLDRAGVDRPSLCMSCARLKGF